MPQLHLAIIFDEGDVWEFSMTANGPSVEDKVLKLPKSRGYFGYSDDKGVLYFIHSEINKPITKFHKKSSKNGHKIVPGSKWERCKKEVGSSNINSVCKNFDYSHGILLGMGFWTFGKKYYGFIGAWGNEQQYTDTDIWNTKREKWLKGPKINIDLIQKGQAFGNYEGKIFSIALNRTMLIFVSGYTFSDKVEVFMVNLELNNWTKYPNLPIDWNEIVNSEGVLTFDKQGHR